MPGDEPRSALSLQIVFEDNSAISFLVLGCINKRHNALAAKLLEARDRRLVCPQFLAIAFLKFRPFFRGMAIPFS